MIELFNLSRVENHRRKIMKKIEFIGLNGSGKSTAVKILEEHLQSKSVFFENGNNARNISIIEKGLNFLNFSLRNFMLFCFILEEIILKRKDKIFLLKKFIRFLYTHEYIRNKDFILLDEGFVFLGCYFHVNLHYKNGFNKKKLEKYINKIPRPDYLIYVQTNFQTAIERMMKRAITRSVAKFNDEQIKNYYLNSFMYFETAAEELEKRGVKVIRICNDSDYCSLKENLNDVFMEIEF
jgi:thymidylate kinase